LIINKESVIVYKKIKGGKGQKDEKIVGKTINN
jgi:hypothetical protein